MKTQVFLGISKHSLSYHLDEIYTLDISTVIIDNKQSNSRKSSFLLL